MKGRLGKAVRVWQLRLNWGGAAEWYSSLWVSRERGRGGEGCVDREREKDGDTFQKKLAPC